jgi:ATP phosphoribosyltransferase
MSDGPGPGQGSDMLTLAVSKGRIYEQALPLLAVAGVVPVDDPETSRKLVLATRDPAFRLLVVRAQDVPTYVEHGAADLGIAGRDVLLEHGGDGLYEPLDLGIARCRLVVAGRPDAPPIGNRARVATKYVETARRYFARRGVQVETIKLYGSMELAPLVGLADRIVDVVDTGGTLRANGLAVLDPICDISARLVVNRASMKMKHARVKALIDALESAASARAAVAMEERA